VKSQPVALCLASEDERGLERLLGQPRVWLPQGSELWLLGSFSEDFRHSVEANPLPVAFGTVVRVTDFDSSAVDVAIAVARAVILADSVGVRSLGNSVVESLPASKVLVTPAAAGAAGAVASGWTVCHYPMDFKIEAIKRLVGNLSTDGQSGGIRAMNDSAGIRSVRVKSGVGGIS
jgi:hypothetical protein